MTQTLNRWINYAQPNAEAVLRLFCFPYAGGGSLSFRNWSRSLPTNVEVCPIDLPGRGLRIQEPAFTQLEPLIQAIASALLPEMDKPFAFFGHSMGALLSFELARFLRDNHQRAPLHLYVSGRRSPQIPSINPPTYDLPEPEFFAELRRLNGTPAEVLDNQELMQLLLPTLRADLAVVETYVYSPKAPLDCPITVFGGDQDPEASIELLEAWRSQTSAEFELHMLQGDHFFLHNAQPDLLQLLDYKLQRLSIVCENQV
ncbi:thioesterase II family protein [Pseudanabaena sp. BC1403]|uniref:thioesterase II family protein n=1 Tax=Pseudanabaena sp. BC1403 TaxID=2043171 RepID=UPI000CD9ED51|nr:thioesterase II family protein [Pseudanabaena sp. BC1403]